MKARENEMQFLFVLADLIMLNFSFLLIYLTFNFHFERRIDIYLCLLLGAFSWVLAHLFIRKKILYIHKRFRERFFRLLKRCGVFLIIGTLLYFPLTSLIGHTWIYLLSSALFFCAAKIALNYLYFLLIKRRYKKSSYIKRSLLIGTNETMQKVRIALKSNPILKYRFVGFLSDEHEKGDLKSKKIIGHYSQLEELIKEHNIHAVFKAVNNTTSQAELCIGENGELLKQCNRLGVRLFFVPVNEKIETGEISEEYLDGLLILNPQKIPLDIIENQVKKRVFDLVFSSLVIIFLLSWLYPIIGLLIKLSSKGPVLFTQQRTGINKVTFDCYKFRSMRPNKEADLKQATEDDPRITRIGKFIRKTNIDELPQFINVFKGEMSVVGPRPHMVKHTEMYSSRIDDYLVRHYVKPGVTGWAQVNGYRGETKELWMMQKRVEYDRYYIENWTFDWDFVIVWKTIFDMKAFMNAG